MLILAAVRKGPAQEVGGQVVQARGHQLPALLQLHRFRQGGEEAVGATLQAQTGEDV